MNYLSELRLLCQKFESRAYSIEDLSQTLAYFPSPEIWRNLVADAEDAVERVRFLISEDQQYEEVVKIISLFGKAFPLTTPQI